MKTFIDPSDTHLGNWLGSRESNVSASESSATTDAYGPIWGTGSHRVSGSGAAVAPEPEQPQNLSNPRIHSS